MTQEEIKTIIENHQHWLKEDCEGWETMRAYLSHADLSGAYLSHADLSGANLSGANLSGANLSGANLSGANLSGANLSHADLSGANLSHAYLSGADLSGADLSGADLSRANLSRANLSGAYLSRANLSRADLSHADLSGANLSGAYLSRADLSHADLSGADYNYCTAFFAFQCPEEGSYIAWKKCRGLIVKLEIPADAKRSSATTRKCRASKAVVLEIQNLDGTKADVESIQSYFNENFVYEVGKTVEVEHFNEDRWEECTSGIHHFITRQEAVNY